MGQNPDLLALGREINRRRKAQGISQETLAELADLHRNYIGCLERGERNPSTTVVFRLARALKMPLAELVGDLK